MPSRSNRVRSSTTPSNKELKLTKPGTIGASQLNSSVRRTVLVRVNGEAHHERYDLA
jgi:hypothetical protein